MAAVYQAIGNQSAGAASVSVAWPTHVAGDLGLLVIETGGEGTTLTVPSGWTAVTGSPVTDVASTAGSKLQVWYRFAATSTEANVATGDSGDHQVARIVTFGGVDPTTPFDVTPVTDAKTTASTTVTWPTITTATDGALVVLIATRPNDATSVTTFSNPVNSNLTDLLEQGEAGTNAGHGGGFVIVTGTKDTAGATGTTTMTSGTSTTNAEFIIALRPEPNPQSLTPSLYTNNQTFYSATVTPGVVGLTPALFTNDQTFYSPDVTQTGGAQDLTPSLYTNTQTFFSPSVTAAYQVSPQLYSNDQSFFSATVSTSTTLQPGLFTNTAEFFPPTVTTNYTLSPALVTNDQTFYGPIVGQTGAAQQLVPDLYTNAQSFFAPTISTAYQLTPARYTNDQTFFSPTVTQVAPQQSLAPDLYSNTQTFYAAAVAATYTLQPARYINGQDFYSPSVTTTRNVAPALVTNTSTFFPPVVSDGTVTTQEIGFDDYVASGYVASGYVTFPASFTVNQFFSPAITIEPYIAPAGGIGSRPPIRPQDYQPMFGRPRKKRQQDIVFLGS